MNVKTLLIESAQALTNKKSGYSSEELATELRKLASWAYKGLFTEQLEKVVHCEDCKHYKKFHRKSEPRMKGVMLCEYDHTKKELGFYCKNGEPRDE